MIIFTVLISLFVREHSDPFPGGAPDARQFAQMLAEVQQRQALIQHHSVQQQG